jgi:glutamine---fructose-6-phosphate transaminase (isomerizing)
MDAPGFLVDVERAPATLAALADVLDRDELPLDAARTSLPVLLLGMGSSAYAAGVAAARLRSAGAWAVADLASSTLLPPPAVPLLVVAVSASGASAETVAAAERYAGKARLVAVTEDLASPLAALADLVLPLHAGPEPGGVACRSYRHTLAVLLALADRLAPGCAPGIAEACRRAADSTASLLAGRRRWLDDVGDRLRGPDGCWVAGPAARLSSAQQSALMLREGPRVAAHAAETGDWSHVDVYLTKTHEYRLLLLPGSPYDSELLRWTADRGSTVVAVGAPVPGAAVTVAYDGHDDPDVALLTETTVAELVAHAWWQPAGG